MGGEALRLGKITVGLASHLFIYYRVLRIQQVSSGDYSGFVTFRQFL